MKWATGVLVAGVFLGNLLNIEKVRAVENLQLWDTTAPLSGLSSCTPPPAGLVAWWPGEGKANDVVNGNNGTLLNGGYASGEAGQAFLFSGTDSYVSISDSPLLDSLTNSMTVELWIKASQLTANADWKGLVTKGNSSWRLQATTFTNTVNWAMTGVTPFELTGTRNVNDGQWHHVAAVYDGTNTFLYVDGTLDVSQPATGVIAQNNDPVCIGANAQAYVPSCGCTTFGYFFNGAADEVSIYRRALSASEIKAIYNAGSAGKCALVPPAVPQIFSVSPAIATNGTTVTVVGTNFNSIAASNIVYFGAVQAAAVSASLTNLIVTVPSGATFAPVTVTVNGLTAFSDQPFEPTFSGSGTLSSSSLAERVDLAGGSGPSQVAFGDLDGDGKPDMAVANIYDGSVWLYRNLCTNGTLTTSAFAPPVVLSIGGGSDSVWGLALADLDGDGHLDIVVPNRNLNIISIYQNQGLPGGIATNSFLPRLDIFLAGTPRSVAVADLDGDGKPEIVVCNEAYNTVSVLRNIATGGVLTTNSFTSAVSFAAGTAPVFVAIGDLDGDSRPDLAIANAQSSDRAVMVLRNTTTLGDISSNSFAAGVGFPGLDTTTVAIGDLDGDGKLDLVTSSFAGGQAVSVYRNTSLPGSINTNSFSPRVDLAAGGWANNVVVGDLDGDGKLDLALLTQQPDHFSIFRNISSPGNLTVGSFESRLDYAAGWNPNGMAIGDLDGDGRPDIAFGVAYAATVSIYQNIVPFNGPPVITTQPASQSALAGTNVLLAVTASGVAPLTYQWSFNGTNILGATNDTLNLANLHVSQGGSYHATVANTYGTATSLDAVITVIARDILVYNYSGKEQVTTLGQEFAYNYSGQMFFLPAGTNGTFVGWATLNGKKQYWVSPLAGYLWATIPGKTNHVFTVLGRAGDGIDENGHPHLWSYLHRGLNAQLTIATKRKFSFPNSFDCNDTHVYPDAQTGNMILREATSSYQFASGNTQTANNTGQTLTDLVNALTKSLEKQGYQRQ